MAEKRKRIVIMGAAGRDFHNFNRVYRDDPASRVVAFTATQIPQIAGRRYPAALAGSLYPDGVPIIEETEFQALCRRERIDQVVFAYSDVSHVQVMHKASEALAEGADFLLLGPDRTMLDAKLPVIAVSAVRTGCGKSQVTRYLAQRLKDHGVSAAIVRHPMPYGDLAKQAVQRFASRADLDAAHCSLEEREEYEPHIALGNTVYGGIDYEKIVALAEEEADVILWEGGNNDFPFIRPDLHIVLADPLRAGHETTYHPGEAVLRMADVIVVVKADVAAIENVQSVTAVAQALNPKAAILRGASPVHLEDENAVRGRRALVIEDGPTLTHGGMAYGAGYIAASGAKAAEIVDPRSEAAGEIAALYAQYPHMGPVLPAVGYHPAQLRALGQTINAVEADVVVVATPCNIAALMPINKPVVRVRYEFAEMEEPGLAGQLAAFLKRNSLL